MNKDIKEQDIEKIKQEFERKFTYVQQDQDPLTGKVYRHREFNPNNLVTITDDVWNFFLPYLQSQREESEEK